MARRDYIGMTDGKTDVPLDDLSARANLLRHYASHQPLAGQTWSSAALHSDVIDRQAGQRQQVRRQCRQWRRHRRDGQLVRQPDAFTGQALRSTALQLGRGAAGAEQHLRPDVSLQLDTAAQRSPAFACVNISSEANAVLGSFDTWNLAEPCRQVQVRCPLCDNKCSCKHTSRWLTAPGRPQPRRRDKQPGGCNRHDPSLRMEQMKVRQVPALAPCRQHKWRKKNKKDQDGDAKPDKQRGKHDKRRNCRPSLQEDDGLLTPSTHPAGHAHDRG